MKRRAFDHNAGAPITAAARAAMCALLDAGVAGAIANPSSIHAAGRAARARLEAARAQVAALAGVAPEQVIFTASGSEAIALGLIGLARRARAAQPRRTRVLVGASEHPAVHGAAAALAREGYTVASLPVDEAGVVRADAVALDDSFALVAVQAANHETGVVQPAVALAERARAAGVPWFCDAVQAAGKLSLAAYAGAAALALSSAKLGGPSGAGALVLARGQDVDALWPGGHQERGRRAGTEPLLAIAGFGAAAAEAGAGLAGEVARVGALRDRLEAGLRALGAEVIGGDRARVANTCLCAWRGVPGPLLVMALDLEGFACSTGAACSSGSLAPSAVLLAAGRTPARAGEAVRFSLGRGTEPEDVDALLAVLPSLVARVRASGGGEPDRDGA